jgi:hypothetical protein
MWCSDSAYDRTGVWIALVPSVALMRPVNSPFQLECRVAVTTASALPCAGTVTRRSATNIPSGDGLPSSSVTDKVRASVTGASLSL